MVEVEKSGALNSHSRMDKLMSEIEALRSSSRLQPHAQVAEAGENGGRRAREETTMASPTFARNAVNADVSEDPFSEDSIIFSCPPPWNDAGEVGAVTVTAAKRAESSMDTVEAPAAAFFVPFPGEDTAKPRGSWLGPAPFDQEDILPIDGTADRADLFGQPERLLDVTGSSKCEEEEGCIIPGTIDAHKEAILPEDREAAKAEATFETPITSITWERRGDSGHLCEGKGQEVRDVQNAKPFGDLKKNTQEAEDGGRMHESFLLCSVIFVTVFGPRLFCDGATHWIVTEDGRIQQQVDSIFNLKRPFDLVTFIRQQDTFDKMRKLKEEYLQEKRKVIEAREKERQEMRQSFYSNDLDCLEAGTAVAEFDLQLDTVSSFGEKGINVADHVDMCQSLPKRPGHPFCTGELPFRMYSYDHLMGVSARHEVDYTVTEHRLAENLPYFKDVDALGSQLKFALQKKPNSWVLLNLAAYYWRIKGNGLHAVECLRRALHYSPREHRDRALMSLAAVLHHAEHTTDSIILMHASLEITDDLVIHLLLLGNLYSHLKMYDMAELCYKLSAALTLETREFCERVKAVRCEQKLITMLEARQLAFDENLDSLKTPELNDGDEAVKEELSKSHTLPKETFRRQLDRLYNERIGLTETTLCRNYKSALTKQDQSWPSDRGTVSEKDMGAEKKERKNATASIQKELIQDNRSRETLAEKIGEDVPEARKDEATLESKTKEGKRSTLYNAKGSVDSSNGSFEEKSLIHDLEEAPVPLGVNRVSSANGAKKNDGLDDTLPSQLPFFGDHKTIEGEERAEGQTGKQGRGTEPRTGKLGRAGRRGEVGFKKGKSESNLDTRDEKDAGRTLLAEGAKIPKQKGDLTTLMSQNGQEQGAGSKNAREISRAGQIEQPMSGVPLGPKHLPPLESKESQIQQRNCQNYGRKKRKGEAIMNECLNQMRSGEPEQSSTGNRNVPNPGEASLSTTTQFPSGLSSNLVRSSDRPQKTMIDEVLSTKLTKNNIATNAPYEDSAVMPHSTFAEISPAAVLESSTKTSISVSQTVVHDKQTVVATDLTAKQVVNDKLDSIPQGNETKRSMGSKATVKPIRSPDDHSFTGRQDKKKTKKCDNKATSGCSAFETSFTNVNTAGPEQDLSEEECSNIKGVEALIARNKLFSAWLSLETKNIDVQVHIDFLSDVDDLPRRPRCHAKIKNNQHTFDQLQGVVNAAKLEQVVEAGLTQTLLTIGRIKQSSVDELGTRIYNSMKKNSSSWILLNIASLYWRVLGDTTEAIKCLRQALYFSPPSSRDVAQVSLASILLREGRLEDTLVVIKKALEISPSLALGHFILGNVFGAQNKIPEAIQHYLFAIQLEPGFSPVIERLKIIQCVLWRQQKDLEKEADELRKLLNPT